MIRPEFFSYDHLSSPRMRELSKLFHDSAVDGSGWVIDVGKIGHAISVVSEMFAESRSTDAIAESNVCITKLVRAIEVIHGDFSRAADRMQDMEKCLRLILEAKDCAIRALVIEDIDRQIRMEIEEKKAADAAKGDRIT